jgi:hypothetical protein
MVPIKNNCSLQNDFGNGWGLYVDIENLKTLPKSYEIIRTKINTQPFCDETNNEIVDEDNYYKKYIFTTSSSIIILLTITYIIFAI